MSTATSELPVAVQYQEILLRLQELHQRRLLAGERDENAMEEPGGITICAAAEDEELARNPRIQVPSRAAKEEGALAELAYVLRAGKFGIRNARPDGDILPFDRIAIWKKEKGFRLRTVQVRCTLHRHTKNTYTLNITHCAGKPYDPGDFDYLAALVVPVDAWYIIPFKYLPPGGTHITLHPCAPSLKGFDRYDRWLSRWDLLQGRA